MKEGPDEQGSADLGYSIVPEHQGKGYATEIARAVQSGCWKKPDSGVSWLMAT
ncbi:GNAT family N-acetyltransferase [Thermoactinomyces mirandus]|uniref:GNAT family N-acetyltransferase n=1 Tax=Thermoactinomyces mirandus TaxID=2756294 RepID=A0A7W1XQZ5_9BACL|nr:GNAT family N-acetyltransferase [Thermoactinomyces mirandus]MBA4601674.1 GNAT family N-acetyltransferase [Thermoactinomyces mirandus]